MTIKVLEKVTPEAKRPHQSVLLHEVVEYLDPKDGEVFVDGTFGAGGHSRAILDKANCRVIGIDRDPDTELYARQLLESYLGRFQFVQGEFSRMSGLLKHINVEKVDGILLDLGVSSMQLDQAARGFSFRYDGPLDMRMGQHGITAQQMLHAVTEAELANIIFHYGDERYSRKIAREIVKTRAEKPITSTAQLADIVRRSVNHYDDAIDSATRTFQALRIWINDELGELTRFLHTVPSLLAPGGRLVVITFHSLEDKIVKRFFQEYSGREFEVNRHFPSQNNQNGAQKPTFRILTPKPIKTSLEECKENPRSRSAKLRAAIKLSSEEGA